MGLFLQERRPRPKTLVYQLHRARAVVRHQAGWLLPLVTGAVYAVVVSVLVVVPLGVTNLTKAAGAIIAPAGIAAWGAHALWKWLSARLYAWLDERPPSQKLIARGYRLPAKPTFAEPALLLGEAHPARAYTSDGDYTLQYSAMDSYSPTPEWCVIPARGLCTGLLVLGATGAGKTTYVIRPAAFGLFKHPSHPGGLVMDAKASLVEPLQAELADCGREQDLLLIGPSRPTRWNPLHAPEDSPAAIADRLLNTIENLNGEKYGAESRWIRRGTVLLAEGVVGVLRLRSGYVTPLALRALLGELVAITQGVDSPSTAAATLVEALFAGFTPANHLEYTYYRDLIRDWASEDEKFRVIYVSELLGLIIPLTSPYVVEQYSAPLELLDMPSWPEVINRGLIACLDANSAAVPGLSVILGTMLKLGFQATILARVAYIRSGICNAERYMCLIIDEFQDFVSPADHQYLAKARESKAITILATQGWPSIVEKVGENAAKVLAQNMRNKLILTQEYPDAPDAAADMLGQTEFIDITKSVNESVQGASLHATGKFAGDSTVSETINQQRNRRHSVPPELLASLPTGQAILRSNNGKKIMPTMRVYLRPYFDIDSRHADQQDD